MAQVEQFLLLIGAKKISRDLVNGWVRCSCPFAAWLHISGKDDRPSFGVKIPSQEGKAPYFYCFSCASAGPLPRLLHNLTNFTGDRMLEASNYLSQFALFDENDFLREKRRFKVIDKFASGRLENRSVLQNIYVPQEILFKYPILSEKCSLTAHYDALLWLTKTRNISLRAIDKFQLRLYIDDVLDDVGIIFPIIDRGSEHVLDMYVRLISQKRFFRLSKDITKSLVDYRAPNLWFGNHLYVEGQPVILVEGPMDALRLYTLGIENVLASFGEPSAEQIASVYAPVVHLAYDNDTSGHMFMRKLRDKLDVPNLHILDWGVVGIKDAGDLADLAQFRVVYDARVKRELPVKRSDERSKTAKRPKPPRGDWFF
jgi:hypothetical protein